MFKEYIHYESLTDAQKNLVKKFINDKSYIYEYIDCPICLKNIQSTIFKNDRYGIKQKTVLCENCGLVFSNPRMNYDSQRKFYNSDTYRFLYAKLKDDENLYEQICNELNNYKFEKPKKPKFKNYYQNLYLDFINDTIKDFDSVLDIGCGKGFKLLDFKNLKKNVLGVEPSNILVKCHKKFNINSINGFIEDVNENHDLVILSHVLEHLCDLKGSLKKIQEITNKYLYIEVPGHFKKIQSIQNAHNYYFSANTLNFFLENNHFKLMRSEYVEDCEFILAIYKKTKQKNQFNYNFNNEKKLIKKIIFKYKVKYLILKILRLFKIEKPIKNLRNYLKKLFFQKAFKLF